MSVLVYMMFTDITCMDILVYIHRSSCLQSFHKRGIILVLKPIIRASLLGFLLWYCSFPSTPLQKMQFFEEKCFSTPKNAEVVKSVP